MKLNGAPLKITDKMEWPEHMPEKGTLQLRFDTIMAPPGNAEPIQDDEFQNIRKEMANIGANDPWRLTLLRLVGSTYYFTSQQGDVLVRCFVWPRERVEACTVLFGRIVDPQNISHFTASLNACVPCLPASRNIRLRWAEGVMLLKGLRCRCLSADDV